MPSAAGPITVVVPTHNSSGTIESCLQAIVDTIPAALRQVIVVDNGSTDRTLELVERFPVQLERLPRGFVSISRNAAAALAQHPVLAFVDSDCVVQPGWREATLAVLADSTVGATGCRYELRSQPTWVEHAWDRAQRRRSTDERAEVRYLPGGNLALWRDVFLAVGGFDSALETGEDMDLCARVAERGYRIVEARSIRCVHLGEPRTLRAVFRRNRWHGRGTRLRYADGRLAPIMVSTVMFASLTGLGLLGVLAAFVMRTPWPALAVLGAAFVPAVYALRYARRPWLVHVGQLLLVYGAYFLGRAAALPVVARRLWRGSRAGL